jgi:CO/xanthine dehydrogenase FAD-binding subunit
LFPLLSRDEQQPSLLVDLRGLGLEDIRVDGEELVLGARVTYDALVGSEIISRHAPLLALMAKGVTGGRSITGQGTIGGSACYANPASDVPACLLALRARLRLVSLRGTRDIPASQFFTGSYQTLRRPDEFLAEIRADISRSVGAAGYHKLKFAGSSSPIVTAASTLQMEQGGIAEGFLAIGGAGPVPIGSAFHVRTSDRDSVEAAVKAIVRAMPVGWSDELADGDYRRAVAPEVARIAIEAALEQADG